VHRVVSHTVGVPSYSCGPTVLRFDRGTARRFLFDHVQNTRRCPALRLESAIPRLVAVTAIVAGLVLEVTRRRRAGGRPDHLEVLGNGNHAIDVLEVGR